MDYLTAEFHRDTWKCNDIFRFVSVYIPWNGISNSELQWSFNALRGALVLPSACTLSNSCRREYSLTVDAIKKELPSANKVSLASDGWTSTKKLAIKSVIAYCIDRSCTLQEVQLAIHEVDSPFFFVFWMLIKNNWSRVNILEQY